MAGCREPECVHACVVGQPSHARRDGPSHVRHVEPRYSYMIRPSFIMFLCCKSLWGAVAERLEHATDNLLVAVSNATEAVWKLLQFPLPHFVSVFWKIH